MYSALERKLLHLLISTRFFSAAKVVFFSQSTKYGPVKTLLCRLLATPAHQ